MDFNNPGTVSPASQSFGTGNPITVDPSSQSFGDKVAIQAGAGPVTFPSVLTPEDAAGEKIADSFATLPNQSVPKKNPDGTCSPANLDNVPDSLLRWAVSAFEHIVVEELASMDVRNYGAKISDDLPLLTPSQQAEVNTPAIQTAINDCWYNKLSVSFPSGKFYVTGLTLPYDATDTRYNLTLFGSGNTVLESVATDGSHLISSINPGPAIAATPVYTIKNMNFVGNPTCGDGLNVSGIQYPTVRVYSSSFAFFTNSGARGIYVNSTLLSSFDDVGLGICDIGMKLGPDWTACCSITRIRTYACKTYALWLDHVYESNITTGAIESTEKTGVYMYGCQDVDVSAIHFENNNSSATPDCHALLIEADWPSVSTSNCNFSACIWGNPTDSVMIRGHNGLPNAICYNINISGRANPAAGVTFGLGAYGCSSSLIGRSVTDLNGPTSTNWYYDGTMIYGLRASTIALGTSSSPSCRWRGVAASAPVTDVLDGDIYKNSGDNKIYIRAGGAWDALT